MAGRELEVKNQARIHWAFQEDGPSDFAGDGHTDPFVDCAACRRNLVFYGVPETELDEAIRARSWAEYENEFVFEFYVTPHIEVAAS